MKRKKRRKRTRKERGSKKRRKKEENRKDKLTIILKTLGELFIEFFWIIHEIMELVLKENENDKRKIVYISLSNKNYLLKDPIAKDDKETILKLILSDAVIYELNEKYVKRLKVETTRALYFLLSESKEIFCF